MNYTDDPSSVRVDLFKPSGKWYTTIVLKWDRYFPIQTKEGGGTDIELIHDTFRRLMEPHTKTFNREGWIAVCIEPYHEHAHPLLIIL